ncbi:MAG TPA: fluoride efflux transporter CrcB [Chloroflexota bacterium]|jgi:CrcB protein
MVLFRPGGHRLLRTILFISLGAVVGANARYAVAVVAAERFGPTFPYGTFAINVSGSFLVALFLTYLSDRLVADPAWRLVLATGFCGSYTTFSTYTVESVTLLRQGSYALAALYVLGSAAVGLLAIIAGTVAARLI